LIGVPIRLCKSRYHVGTDAVADRAEIPVAIEDIRYQTGSLDLRDLEGELAAATRTYPDIQLWVLATSVEVHPFSGAGTSEYGREFRTSHSHP